MRSERIQRLINRLEAAKGQREPDADGNPEAAAVEKLPPEEATNPLPAAAEPEPEPEAEVGEEEAEEHASDDAAPFISDPRIGVDPATGEPYEATAEDDEEEGPEAEPEAEDDADPIDKVALEKLAQEAAEQAERDGERLMRDKGLVQDLTHEQAAELVSRTMAVDRVRARELARARQHAVGEYVRQAVHWLFVGNPDLVPQQKEVAEWIASQADKGRWLKDFDPGVGVSHSMRVAMEIADEYRRLHPVKKPAGSPKTKAPKTLRTQPVGASAGVPEPGLEPARSAENLSSTAAWIKARRRQRFKKGS